MIKWPGDCKDENDVYSITEYGTLAGRYPVGENRAWHSGVHIRSLTNPFIYPIIAGELAAYHISTSYKTVKRLQKISKKQYERLNSQEQCLYEKVQKELDAYRLKPHLADDMLQHLEEKHSNSFILLRHSFSVPAANTTKTDKSLKAAEQFYFFTLYTNIAPTIYREKKYVGVKFIPKRIPFYEKYKFKVSEDPYFEYPYTEREGVKLFPRSFCTVWEKDDETYLCNFLNFNNEEKRIEVQKSEITLLELKKYRPKSDDVKIYRVDMLNSKDKDAEEENLKQYELATLTTDAYFQMDIEKCGDEYFQVLVYPSEVKEDGATGKPFSKKTQALVRINDLFYSAKGCLEEDNSFCTEKMKGVMIYDEKDGNARDIFPAGKEIEPRGPAAFLAVLGNTPQYVPIKTENSFGKYILYRQHDPEEIEAQIVLDSTYTLDTTIIPEEQETIITPDMLMGFSYRPPAYSSPYYDLVLLFENNFMETTSGHLDGYAIPAGTELYTAKDIGGGKISTLDKGIATRQPVIFQDRKENIYTAEKTLEKYIRLKYAGQTYFLPSTMAEKYKKNLLDWESFFRIIDTKPSSGLCEHLEDFIKSFFHDEPDNDGDIFYNNNPDWYKEIPPHETLRTREIKRTIVCCHPLEWDKMLYLKEDEDTIKSEAQWKFMQSESDDDKRYFKEYIKAIDIWNGLANAKNTKGEAIKNLKNGIKGGLRFQLNSYWFAHPIYFISHLDKAGLLAPYVNVLDNNDGDNIIAFYNRIADIAKNVYARETLQCVNFVHDMIRDKLRNGGGILNKVSFYKEQKKDEKKQANVLFDEFQTNKNLQPLKAVKVADLTEIQDEADKGTLILASFKSTGEATHGHLAFVGCRGLKISAKEAGVKHGKKPKSPEEEGRDASTLEPALRTTLVQAGTFCGIVSIYLGTNGWRPGGDFIREKMLAEAIKFYAIKKD